MNSIKSPDYRITPKLNCYGTKTRAELSGSYLKQDKIVYSWENSKYLHCL